MTVRLYGYRRPAERSVPIGEPAPNAMVATEPA
ncbi:hypothetical protein J2S55_008584 [Streptosporangium brasiliense]|uniref:Uncharacterized protein n=1 Tax=Streptosporangium brasiliense TaxID=47480 RepID=A0ABT9RJQ5_9ACTN|nr:hypothetical protein [Streptosporangium brasiliense]